MLEPIRAGRSEGADVVGLARLQIGVHGLRSECRLVCLQPGCFADKCRTHLTAPILGDGTSNLVNQSAAGASGIQTFHTQDNSFADQLFSAFLRQVGEDLVPQVLARRTDACQALQPFAAQFLQRFRGVDAADQWSFGSLGYDDKMVLLLLQPDTDSAVGCAEEAMTDPLQRAPVEEGGAAAGANDDLCALAPRDLPSNDTGFLGRILAPGSECDVPPRVFHMIACNLEVLWKANIQRPGDQRFLVALICGDTDLLRGQRHCHHCVRRIASDLLDPLGQVLVGRGRGARGKNSACDQ